METIDKVNLVREKVKAYYDAHAENCISANSPLWQKRNKDHIVNCAVSVYCTANSIMQGGSFVTALVKNDLERTLACADVLNSDIHVIKFYIRVLQDINISFDETIKS